MKTILFWFPRLLAITAILFVSMFALDSFDPTLSFGAQITGFLIHLIPSFILLLILLVAWKWELIGGSIFGIIGIVSTPLIFFSNYRNNQSVWISLSIVLIITVPFLVVGALFILNYFREKEKHV